MRIPRTIAAGLAGATLLTGALATAAAAQEPADQTALEALCARIAPVQERLTTHRDRILADAETPGSVAWLEARADQAEANGRTRIAEQLRERADRRAARVEVIDIRLEELSEAAAACAESVG